MTTTQINPATIATIKDLRDALNYQELERMAEELCAQTNTRRDGVVWGHSVSVRNGKKCATVVELRSQGSVKAWAQNVAAELRKLGLVALVGKCVEPRIGATSCTAGIKDGWECWISITNVQRS